MTFLHKLAKRLSLTPFPAISFITLVASCSQGTVQDYLGPDPRKPGNSSGNYIGLSITPHDPQAFTSDSVHLEARGWLATGESVAAQVTWSASGGTVNSDGWFRSDGSGDFRVRAVSVVYPTLSDSVQVNVRFRPGIARLDVTPGVAELASGTFQKFTAIAVLSDGSTTLPTVDWSAEGGSIAPDGMFRTSATLGEYRVTATLGDGAVVGFARGQIKSAVLTQLSLTPSTLQLEPGDIGQFSVQLSWSDGAVRAPALTWDVQGGSISSDGVFAAGATPGSYRVIVSNPTSGKADTSAVTVLARVVSIRVAPTSALLALGATQVMRAYALRSDGKEGPIGVTWTAQGGSIALNGTYAAGSVAGQYPVVATLHTLGGETFSASAGMQVGPITATLNQLILNPSAVSLQTGQTAQFSVAASWSDGGSATPAVTWSATGGTIDAGGLYSAGATAGSYRVIVTQQGGGKADTSAVTVASIPVPTVSAFTISPKSSSLQAGQTGQFGTALSWSDGQSHPATISWVASGGTITQNGMYTAGSIAGQFLVIAACSCGSADTAAVGITAVAAAAPKLTSLLLLPGSAVLAPQATKQFSVSGTWSDGATSAPAVVYFATGGSITAAGLYTAGSIAGADYRVIATQVGGGLADTSAITISQATPTLSQLVMNPSAVTVPSGGTQQFAVSAIWSDGSTTVPPLSFSATGGTVSAAGLYTAGSAAGTYSIIVAQQGGTKADTSAVTIPAGVTLTSVTLTPASVTLAQGATQQFVATGTWSDGSSVAPQVTYSATGGTMSHNGIYSAGSIAGQFLVIATCSCGVADTSAVTIAPLTTPAGTDTVSLTVVRFASGTGDALVSNGIPLPPGRLSTAGLGRVRVLVGGVEQATYVEALKGHHSDGSLRSILVQFHVNLGTNPVAGLLDLGTLRSVPGIAKTAIPLGLPVAAALPASADYLVSTNAAGPMITVATALQAGLPAAAAAHDADFPVLGNQLWTSYGASMNRGIAVYDHPLTYYQYWLRTGNPLWWNRATQMAAVYRQYVSGLGKGIAPWMVNTESLAMHYWFTGDDVTRVAIGVAADAMLEACRGPQYDTPDNMYWIGGTLGDDRMRSRCLMSAIDANLVEAPFSGSKFGGYTSLAAVTTALNDLLPTEAASGAFGGTYYAGGQKNYMVGMLLSAIIRYYDEIAPDSRIPGAVQRAIDYMWSTQWVSASQGFKYISNNLVPSEGGTGPTPGLNLLILPAFAWYYGQTGNTTYRDRADLLVQGVRQLRSDWLGFPMQFDQAYYRFANYLFYRSH
jgi:hypothetical protein